MKIIFPSFQKFLWSETRQIIITSLIAWVVVFIKWKSVNSPDPSLWFGRALVIYGVIILVWLPLRWAWLVPKAIEINEAVVAFCFYFRKRICFSFEDIDKCYSPIVGVSKIRLKNGRIIRFMPSPYSGHLWTQLLKKGKDTRRGDTGAKFPD